MGSELKERRQTAAKYELFEDKQYLRMLVMTATCPLTHSERLVLSYRVFKARDAGIMSITKTARVLRLDRHTVAKAIKSLDANGIYVDNPVTVKPEWFAKPHRDGSPRCYRHYYLASGLSELENSLYWMLWSLATQRSLKQSKSGLAVLTNYSRYRVILGIRSLVEKGLITAAGRKITLLDPPTLDYWVDRKQTTAKPVVQKAQEPTLSEDWVAVMVDFFGQGAPKDKDMLVQMIEMRVGEMKAVGISLDTIEEYWRSVLRVIRDAEKAWDFACYKFDYLLSEALGIHRKKGQAQTCIGILKYLTKQVLDKEFTPW